MATRTLQIVLAGDSSDATREFRKVEHGAKRMGDNLGKEGNRVRGFASISSKGFSRVGLAAGGMATAGAGAAALLAKSFVSGATSINESLSKNLVLFGQHADTVDRFTQRTAKNFGISRQAALEATGTFGNLFTALEIGPKKSAGMSIALTKLAADMASFNNASPEEALEAIRSGLVGETEPLRKFGVNVNDAALRTQALKMGLIDTVKNALTPQQKALAVQKLLFEQTSKAQGDFARTSGGLANQQRILKARLADSGAELGAKLMPAALAAVRAINSLFNSSTSGGRAVSAMGKVAAQAAGWLKEAWGTAVVAVSRFVRRNREDIDQAIRAVRNFGRGVRFVIEEIVIPVFKRLLPVIQGRLEGMVQILRGVVRIISGIINGDWKRVWEGFKDIPLGMFKIVKSALVALWKALRDGMKALVPLAGRAAKAIGKAIVDGIVAGVKAAPGAVKDAIGGVLDGAFDLAGDLVGDGVGKVVKGARLPSAGAFGGSLMGANVGMKPFAALGSGFGLGVTSGLRPGSITSSGNPSWHGTGEAIDMGNGRGPDANKLNYFKMMKRRFGSRLAELIYTPGGVGIKNGRPFTYTGAVAADHYDHVHVAVDLPGVGDGIGRLRYTGDGIGQAVQAAKAAGFRGQDLINAVAIAGAESRFNPAAQNLKYPDHSIGLWQINQLAHKGRFGTDAQLKNPMTNAKAAYALFKASGFGPWSTWPGAAQAYLARARAAVSTGGGTSVVKKKTVGVLTGPGAGGKGTQLDRLEAAEAMASLTDSSADDIKAADKLVAYRQRQLFKANTPAKRRDAAQALRSALDARAALNPSADGAGGGSDAAAELAAAIAANTAALADLKAEMKRQTDFGERVQSTENFQLKKYLADVVSSQVVGYGVVGRSFTPGTGVEFAYAPAIF